LSHAQNLERLGAEKGLQVDPCMRGRTLSHVFMSSLEAVETPERVQGGAGTEFLDNEDVACSDGVEAVRTADYADAGAYWNGADPKKAVDLKPTVLDKGRGDSWLSVYKSLA
jgi:hypothetical protein